MTCPPSVSPRLPLTPDTKVRSSSSGNLQAGWHPSYTFPAHPGVSPQWGVFVRYPNLRLLSTWRSSSSASRSRWTSEPLTSSQRPLNTAVPHRRLIMALMFPQTYSVIPRVYGMGAVLLIAAFLSTLDQDICMNATFVLLQEGHSAAPCFYSSPEWRTHLKNSSSSK